MTQQTAAETITVTEAERMVGTAGDQIVAGQYLAMTMWEDAKGFRSDMLTGQADTAAEALAQARALETEEQTGDVSLDRSITLYLVVADEEKDDTPATAQTIADRIADALGNDGTIWRTPDGVTIDQLAEQADGFVDRHPIDPDLCRWTFPDGSAITASDLGWDIGFATCWCWAGSPHDFHPAANGQCDEGEYPI